MSDDAYTPGCIDSPVKCSRCGRTVLLSANPALNEIAVHRPMSGGKDRFLCKRCDGSMPTKCPICGGPLTIAVNPNPMVAECYAPGCDWREEIPE